MYMKRKSKPSDVIRYQSVAGKIFHHLDTEDPSNSYVQAFQSVHIRGLRLRGFEEADLPGSEEEEVDGGEGGEEGGGESPLTPEQAEDLVDTSTAAALIVATEAGDYDASLAIIKQAEEARLASRVTVIAALDARILLLGA